MANKYGIRYYPETGAYMAFKDTLFVGVLVKRQWITNEGTISDKYDEVGTCLRTSKEDAIENIRRYFQRQQLISTPYCDEYVYTEEWWHK